MYHVCLCCVKNCRRFLVLVSYCIISTNNHKVLFKNFKIQVVTEKQHRFVFLFIKLQTCQINKKWQFFMCTKITKNLISTVTLQAFIFLHYVLNFCKSFQEIVFLQAKLFILM